MEEVRHADAVAAERRRAPQARTAKEIDSSARLSEMSAQLLRNDRIEPPCGVEGCRAVVLVCLVERSLRGKAWCGHPNTPEFDFPGKIMTLESNFVRKAQPKVLPQPPNAASL
jgi:hypothetical protein